MSYNIVEQQYRRFLFLAAIFAFSGAIVELWFIGHMESTVQLYPYFMCGIGLILTIVTWAKQNRVMIRIFQIVMVLIAMGGIWGIIEHFEHNLAFELEIRPNAVAGDVLWDALSGAIPFLAPGILTFASILALAATWRHPSLSKI